MLTYHQRKALRRLGRGQSIPRKMMKDSVISECFTMDYPPPPPPQPSVVEWCDWEARLHSVRPRINARGRQLLAALEGQ